MADSNTTQPAAGFNLDSVDTVTARLEQAHGVLDALTAARDQLTGNAIDAALWAALELIAQAQTAVRSLNHPEGSTA